MLNQLVDQPESDPFVASLCGWAAQRPAIRGMLLTSTRAVGGARVDRLSDYDVILVVDTVVDWVHDRSWVSDFGDVLVAYWDPVLPDPEYGVLQAGNVVQYQSGLKIDWSLWPHDLFVQILASAVLPPELDAGYRILHDPHGMLAHLPPPSGQAYRPTPPSEAAYQQWVNDFLTDPPYVAKCLWRGDLLPAKWCLDQDMKQIYLVRMLEWSVGVAEGWQLPVGWLGKGLQRRITAEQWQALQQTYVGADSAANWQALYATIALFRQVAEHVGQALGYRYPADLHDRVVAYVQQIQQLPPE